MIEGGGQSRGQRLGRRLGLRPYYRVAAASPGQLELVSLPERNRGAGLGLLVGGALLLLVGLGGFLTAVLSSGGGGDFATVALSAVVGGLFGSLGFQRVAGAVAVLTTRNRVVAGPEGVTFTQSSRLMAERSQSLALAAISEVRLRRRPLAVGWPLRRLVPIVALELLAGDAVWVVDSAADPEELRPAAAGLTAALGRELERQP